jgi:formylglycine-generating enzyme required for sulfatase activity
MTTLDRLVSVRSQLALGLEAYLRAFVDLTAWPASPFLGGRCLVDMYLPPDVVKRDRLDAAAIARRREADRRGAFVREDERLQRTPWAVERQRIQRAVILGRPGEGKTLLTRLTCRAVAQESLTALMNQVQAASEIAVPIWLRVEDILKAGSVQRAVETSTAAADAIERAYPAGAPRPSGALVSGHLVAALSRPSTWLFLDALDEREAPLVDVRTALRSLANLPCRIVVTCRPYAYDASELPFLPDQPNVSEYELAPLTSDQQREFIVSRWFRDDAALGARVLALINAHSQFRDLATNGLLLTLICSTAERHPEIDPATTHRVHLYNWAVRDMVRGAHKNLLQERDPIVRRRQLVLAHAAWTLFQKHPRDNLAHAAWTLFQKGALDNQAHAAWTLFQKHACDNPFFVEEWDHALVAACGAHKIADSPRFRTELEQAIRGAGLLVEPANDCLSFLHRTFFEYLAAVGLAQEEPSRVIDEIAAHVSDPTWREVNLLTISALGLPPGSVAAAGEVIGALLVRAPGAPGVAAALVGEAVADAPAAGVAVATRDRVVGTLLKTMRNDQQVVAKTRAAAGTALGRIGDPRFRADAWFLPDEPMLGFIEIPAGPFKMGSDPARDPEADEVEHPEHEVTLPAFFIARYPVTVAQFQAFVEATSFQLADPRYLKAGPNQPVTWVSWAEAMHYCAWLTEKLCEGTDTPAVLQRLLRSEVASRPWRVTLPSEAEWEKAARGEDGRTYPWGNKADSNRANYSASGIYTTSAVGCFPSGASPYAVEDLAGNVWEWTRSSGGTAWERPLYPYVPGEDCEHVNTRRDNNFRIVRGGASLPPRWNVRAAIRYRLGAVARSFSVGFRVAVSPFFSDL